MGTLLHKGSTRDPCDFHSLWWHAYRDLRVTQATQVVIDCTFKRVATVMNGQFKLEQISLQTHYLRSSPTPELSTLLLHFRLLNLSSNERHPAIPQRSLPLSQVTAGAADATAATDTYRLGEVSNMFILLLMRLGVPAERHTKRSVERSAHCERRSFNMQGHAASL